MTLEQLRIFVAVALREHVTQGARDLNLTQSATSAAIAALEARHATRLFDRVGRRVVLTEAGRLFLAEARAVLSRAAEAEAALADLAGLKRGTLRLAGSQTVANYWLPPLMNRYHALYPGIALTLVIGNTFCVAAQVRDGGVDLGVVEGEVTDAALSVDPVDGDELVLVVAPGHPWTVARPEGPAAFAAERWILRERGSGTRSAFESALPALGLTADDLRIALEFPSNEAVRSAVEAGAGAAVLSRLVVAASLLAGTLVAVAAPMPRRRFYALRRRERHVTQAQRAFLALAGATPRPP